MSPEEKTMFKKLLWLIVVAIIVLAGLCLLTVNL